MPEKKMSKQGRYLAKRPRPTLTIPISKPALALAWERVLLEYGTPSSALEAAINLLSKSLQQESGASQPMTDTQRLDFIAYNATRVDSDTQSKYADELDLRNYQTMKKFKLTWSERVEDGDGDLLYMEQKVQVVDAENEDAACDQWENDCDKDLCNGLNDCVEVVEHALFKKHITMLMPDGLTYAIPVEFIARHRAECYANEKHHGDIAESLRNDTLPLFESDNLQIREWAVANMSWSDVKENAIALKKKVSDADYENNWRTGVWNIV